MMGRQAIHQELIRVAEDRRYVHYSDVAPLAGLNMDLPQDRNELSNILDDISLAEHNAGRPLLSAVVIRKDRNMPGDGFFVLARDLELHRRGDDLLYWWEELMRVHTHWAGEVNDY